MKKWVKITLGVVGVVILLFAIDLICIFTINRPLFAIKTENNGSVNNVYKGLFYDTYICNDYSTIQITYKGSKFSCNDTIKIKEFKNYDFSVVVTTSTEYKKIFAFKHNGINYYYGNTDFRLYLTEGNYRYDLETSLKNNLVSFEDILNKNVKIDTFRDGGSKLYYYRQFNIVVCNTIDGNNDVIIGDTELEIGNVCNSEITNNETINYKKTSSLYSNNASTEILVKFDGILYGKSYAIIDYAGGSESIGIIDKLIDSDYVPELNGETNTQEILNAKVFDKTDDTIVIYYNNNYVLFEKIKI